MAQILNPKEKKSIIEEYKEKVKYELAKIISAELKNFLTETY